jgi:hypothetical protein
MSPVERTAAGRPAGAGQAPSVLVLAYAFPPIQVPMSPVASRLVAGLHGLGFDIDVICAHPDVWPLPREDSLLDYANAHCRRVQRLLPTHSVPRRLAHRFRRLRDFPDCMAQLHESAFAAVMAADPSSYTAVLTVSPFHTINNVMVRVKRVCPDLRWIAYFCDPWGGNPLETRPLVRRWNAWCEPRALRAATYVTHSSPEALEMVLRVNPFLTPERTRVVPHVFDPALYPSRPKRRNDKVTLRFIGTLFGRRSPQPLFRALGRLLERRPDLRDLVRLELIGPVHPDLLDGPAAEAALPPGLVWRHRPVSYRESLDLMYDADILLVIEADVAATPFVPSKVTDYMGANTPIIGIVPAGGCRDILQRLGCPTVAPDDIGGLAAVLEKMTDAIVRGSSGAWCDDAFRRSFDLASGAAVFASLLRSDPT